MPGSDNRAFYLVLWCLFLALTGAHFDAEVLRDFLETVLQDAECTKASAITVGVVQGENPAGDFTFVTGKRNTEEKADENTLFGIGSTTKAMTAIVTDKVLKDKGYTWDTPITSFYPSLKLPSDNGLENRTKSVTFRDLYSHTTCLRRSEFWWASGPPSFDVADMMDKLQYMGTWCSYSDTYKNFGYNNLMYVTGAHIIEEMSGKTWETLLDEIILTPLDMTQTKVTFDEAFKTGNTVKGYTALREEFVEIPYEADRIIDLVRAAGSVHSTAADMNKYLRYLLEGEKFYDLFWDISKAVHTQKYFGVPEELKNPPYPATSNMYNYTISWCLGDYKGKEILGHGGDTFTTSTFITLSREEKYGVFASSTGGKKARLLNQLITWYVQDMINGEKPWINATNICTFPEPWVSKEDKSDEEEDEEKKSNDTEAVSSSSSLTEYMTDNPTELGLLAGVYTHKAYGSINITYNVQTGLFFQYHRMNCSLRKILTEDFSFDCVANVPWLPDDHRVKHPVLKVKFNGAYLESNMLEDYPTLYRFNNSCPKHTLNTFILTLGLILYILYL